MSKINQVNYLEGEKTHQVPWNLSEKKGISFLDKGIRLHKTLYRIHI